jgi:hypothetical protein
MDSPSEITEPAEQSLVEFRSPSVLPLNPIDLGDKVWLRIGSMFLVGWVVDTSPNFKYFAVCHVPLKEFLQAKKQMSVHWVSTEHVCLDDILRKEEQKDDEPIVGFAFAGGKA